MVIRNFDSCCITIAKSKDDPILLIDTNAIQSLSVALQGFQRITRRGLEVLQDLCAVQIIELPDGGLEQRGRKSLASSRNVESFGFLVGEADDHTELYNTQRYTVKPYLGEDNEKETGVMNEGTYYRRASGRPVRPRILDYQPLT